MTVVRELSTVAVIIAPEPPPEPVTVTVLIRNVTQQSQTHFRPLQIVAMKSGNILKRTNEPLFSEITMSPLTSLFPQTQDRYQIEVTKDYDLGE